MDDQDRLIISQMRSEHKQLGFAIQLGTVRFLGTFLSVPTNVPTSVSVYVAQQLGMNETILSLYKNERTARHHAQEIKQLYGYHDFTDQPFHFRLVRWLYTRSWISAERPSVLFDLATSKCVENKILLPGVTVMERLIAQVRDRANARIWQCCKHGISLLPMKKKTGKNKYNDAPLQGMSSSWRKLVLKDSNQKINPCAYTFWKIEKMNEALKRHDIYIDPSERYGDPRAQLLLGESWESVKPHILRKLDWSSSGKEELHRLGIKLDETYRKIVESWENNTDVRIEHDRVVLSPLERLEEPTSLKNKFNHLCLILTYLN